MGTCLTVDGRGTKGEGRVLATARVYTQMYGFRPHSEVIIALRLRCSGELSLSSDMCVVLQSMRTLVPVGRGGLYRVHCPS